MFDESISVLVPYKPDGGPRDRNWAWLKKRYELLMPDAELCVGLYNEEPFSRSAALNLAAAMATRDIFLIADADMVFEINQIKAGLDLLPKHAWVLPFVDTYMLAKQHTEMLLQKEPSVCMGDLGFSDCDLYSHSLSQFLLMPRKNFEKVGGFDERFKGWGWEDQAFATAMDSICGPHGRPEGVTVWHMHHPPASYQPKENASLFHEEYWNSKKAIEIIKNAQTEQKEP